MIMHREIESRATQFRQDEALAQFHYTPDGVDSLKQRPYGTGILQHQRGGNPRKTAALDPLAALFPQGETREAIFCARACPCKLFLLSVTPIWIT